MKKIIYIVSIFLTFLLGFISDYIIQKSFKEETKTVMSEITIKEENTLASSLNKIYNAVVVIETLDSNGNSLSTGSGFIYKKDAYAYVITNNHVISNASKINVININDEEVSAVLLGSDEYLDIAVLKIDSSYAPAVALLGTSTDLNIGDTLYTVGSPLGIKYKGTVTKGILSGKDRKVTVKISSGNYIMEVLQTDAAINPGNSGGPLVNINGEVIGVTSLKLVQDEIEGMGFAIPIELVSSSLDKLEKGESIERPILGVSVVSLNDDYLLYKYGLQVTSNITKGIVIVDLEDDYPASNSGLKKGDIITYIDNYEIDDVANFKYILFKYKIGDTLKIKYIRNQKEEVVDVLLTVDMMN